MICFDKHEKGGEDGKATNGSTLRQPRLAQPVKAMLDIIGLFVRTTRFELSIMKPGLIRITSAASALACSTCPDCAQADASQAWAHCRLTKKRGMTPR